MLDSLYIWGKTCLGKLAERFSSEEKGAVEVVTIVVIIGIVIILAAIFREQIASLIQNLLNKISADATNVVTR